MCVLRRIVVCILVCVGVCNFGGSVKRAFWCVHFRKGDDDCWCTLVIVGMLSCVGDCWYVGLCW